MSSLTSRLAILRSRTFKVGVVALVLSVGAGLAQPAEAADGEATITVSDPDNNGSVKVTIVCKRADGTKEKVTVSVAILATDDAEGKKEKIDNAIDGQSPDCFDSLNLVDEIKLDPHEGNKITDVDIEDDDTTETIGAKVESAERVGGNCSFEGTPTGGTATVAVDATSASTSTTGKSVDEVMIELVASLESQAVSASVINGRILIEDDLANRTLSIETTDSGLSQNLAVYVSRQGPAVSAVAAALLSGLVMAGMGWMLYRRRLAAA